TLGFSTSSVPNKKVSVVSLKVTEVTEDVTTTRAPPRTGIAQTLLNMALASPLWRYVMVPQARKTMASTAIANNIPFYEAKKWLEFQIQSDIADPPESLSSLKIPSYYQQAFHAYETGNLSWEAAMEVEIVSCAVGARNFPQAGSLGEETFRGAFSSALDEAGATVPQGGRILDMGCGTGMSTRRLAIKYPKASEIVGVDLSPYFIAVGKRLLELAPASFHNGGPWVCDVASDSRIQYLVGDAANSLDLEEIEECSFDTVNIGLVIHELPPEVAIDMVDEAFQLLKPQGQLWISEMDFEAPAYAAQRANPLLFSLIRATEPYLDDYAESISSLFAHVQSKFEHVRVVPATGRHFALIATKGTEALDTEKNGRMEDLRFDADGSYRIKDTHLQLWENKQ
ncbi:MAG: hypothetical protein SGILL_008946, partial [Bacillariaceae sp.]